jgi:MFS family permease
MRDARMGLWQDPNFLKLWGGRTISLLGSQVTRLALPLVAIFFLSADAPQLGLLSALSSLPLLLFGLFAGVLVDRLPRRPVLIVTDLARAVVLLSIPVVASLGALSLPQLYLVAFASASFGVLFDVAYRSFLPSMVDSKHLVEANGKLEATRPIAEVLGPGLAGLLVQVLMAPFAIVVDGLSYLVSAVSVSLIAVKEEPPAPIKQHALWADVGEGFAFVRTDPLLRAIVIAIGLFELFDSTMMAIYVLYATRELGIDSAFLGLIFATGGVGGIVGALIAQWVARNLRLGWTLVLGISLAALGDLLIPAAGFLRTIGLPILALAELSVGFGGLIFIISLTSLLQVVTPNHLLGRVNATMDVFTGAATLLGALLGGLVSALVGLEPVFVAAGLGTFLSVLAIAVSPIRALARLPEPVIETA